MINVNLDPFYRNEQTLTASCIQFSCRHKKVGLMKTVDSVVDEIFRVTRRDILLSHAAAEV